MIHMDEDTYYGDDIPLLLPGGTPYYRVQELPDDVMPLVHLYQGLLEEKATCETSGNSDGRKAFLISKLKNIETTMDEKGFIRTDDGMWGTKDRVLQQAVAQAEEEEGEYPFFIDTSKAWGGIWIEVTIRATTLVATMVTSGGPSYRLKDTQRRAICAECYKVLGTKMKITEAVKEEVRQIIGRAEQYASASIP